MKKLYLQRFTVKQLALIVCCFILSVTVAFAQTGTIEGIVKTSDGKPAGFVNVALTELNKGTMTAENGTFSIKGVKPGSYTLKCSFIGLESQVQTVTIEAGQTVNAQIALQESASELSEVVITGARTINRKPVEVGKIAINPIDLPQSITIVGNEVITNQQASRMSDVIRNVNGVALGTTRGGTSETFFARGYNLGANSMMKNGSRSNSAVMPEASTLERVEVLKGSAALLYGNVSGGAVVNMVTKKPKFEYGGEVSMRFGSYNLFKPIVDLYGPISKNLAFRVVGTYENAESYRNSVKTERFYVNPSLLYKLGSKTDIIVQADYLDHSANPDFGIGTVAGKIPTSIDRSAYFNTPWAFNDVKQTSVSTDINHQFNDNWKLNFIGSRMEMKRDYFSSERIQAQENGNWPRSLTRSRISEDYYNAQLNLTGTFQTGSIKHQLLVGTDGERYINTSDAFKINLDRDKSYIVKNPNGTETLFYDLFNVFDQSVNQVNTYQPGAVHTATTEAPRYRFGAFAQNLISLNEKFKVLAGLRWSYEEAASPTIAYTSPEFVPNTPAVMAVPKYDKAFSPRLGLVYQPMGNLSFFASYSNNFSPNSGVDINNQALEPSIIDQYEIGVKSDLLKDKLSANVTVYKIINDNLAQQALDASGNLIPNVRALVGETTSDGVEVDLSGTIVNGLSFMAGYSYNDMRFTNTPGGKGSNIEGERLVSMPAHTANGTLFYTFSSSFLKDVKVGFSGFYTGERNAGWNNTVAQVQPGSRLIPVSGFATFDISLGYTYKKLALLGKISNITNELNYYVHENYSVNPIPPRQFVTTLSYKF
ncbi:TonB-dependent receptor [Pontibacter arcticus]|uniref:TonB-dependent siderophore receptor n=1 Tax=Pontibacter arcticus TaxID=2080288 RepID=A0A364RFG6_9BACT|nr:TonB-dependent receptor [Pontibacter arcticus]RAU83039.1 TonB-dependent siderophore receptor [Pontibacter arcticus]